MRKKILSFIVIILAITLVISNGYSQKKLAQTGFQFLSIGQDARASAMGEAFTTVEGVSSALFHNPAGMARLSSFVDVAASQNNWIADIKHNSLSIALNPLQGRYGVFGISAMWVDYGEIQGTMVWENVDGYIDTEVFEPKAIAVGIGYAKYLTDRFAVGGQIKEVAQSLGKSVIPEEGAKKNIASALAFDFGTIYRTGFKSLSFGMSVRNFSEELKFEKEGFQLPLTFKIGVSMDVFDFYMKMPEGHSLLMVMDAVHPRSYPEYINWGAEYLFMDMFALRAGYVSNQDEYGLTYGFGMQKFGLAINYAYTSFGVFDPVQRFTIRFSI
ncbi:PorV/PorQ family protein [candidate division KSB1 bacterium]|nr:PorV/PorQ family protein [candidate division KSB1 bacterium]